MPSGLASFWNGCRQFLKAWLQRDAVRTSPTDRVWLALAPPCITFWEGERIEVLARQEILTEQGIAIQFECLTPRGREFFVVQPGSLHRRPNWDWKRMGQVEE